MKKVILIGTSHTIQRGKSLNPDFRNYVECLVRAYAPQAIAEELEQTAASVASQIATLVGLPYFIIEPTVEERKQLGIPSINEIDNHIFMGFEDITSLEARDESIKYKESAYRARENEWFRRLNKINKWPVLVICGAAHYTPFSDLLQKNGIDVIAECEDWK